MSDVMAWIDSGQQSEHSCLRWWAPRWSWTDSWA